MRRRETPQSSASVQPTSPGDDVLAVLASTATWIQAADTKATILSAAMIALVAVFSSHGGLITAAWPGGPAPSAQTWVLLIGAGSAVTSLVFLVAVVFPRTHAPTSNRFSWPWLANLGPQEVAQLASTHGRDVRLEAWQQASCLAGIAQRKHRHFQRALSAALLAGCSVLATACWPPT